MDVPALLSSIDGPVADIARRVGVSDGHVFDLKSGRRKLTLELAKRFDDALATEGKFVEAAIRQRLAS